MKTAQAASTAGTLDLTAAELPLVRAALTQARREAASMADAGALTDVLTRVDALMTAPPEPATSLAFPARLARLSTRTLRGILDGTATANTDGAVWVGKGLAERLQGDELDAVHALIADEYLFLGDFAPWSDMADLTLALDVLGTVRNVLDQS